MTTFIFRDNLAMNLRFICTQHRFLRNENWTLRDAFPELFNRRNHVKRWSTNYTRTPREELGKATSRIGQTANHTGPKGLSRAEQYAGHKSK